MTEIGEFFHMGGYAIYVWSSYGITLLVMVVNCVLPIMREKNLIKRISKQHVGKSGIKL